MKNLVIVESPTKARTLSRFLGEDYRIEATMGHIRDLPAKKLGIDIEHDFKPLYQVIPGRSKKIKELKDASGAVSTIILATDPDREGEAIAYHIKHVLGEKKKFERIVFHEITKTAIEHALSAPREIDAKLVDAQQARRVLDRLVGYKLSPILWNKLGKNWLSAGRVQSVVVRLIVEREREIQGFKAEEYWVIEVELESGKSKAESEKASFLAKLAEMDGRKVEIKNKETSDAIVSDLKKGPYSVKNVVTKEVRRFPYPPFTTSTLQQAGSNKFGWSAKRTMQTAQKLYEEGYITYHRTDSTNLSKDAIEMVRGYIKATYGDKYIPESPTFYKTKSKVAQEAHEAIRPTAVGQSASFSINLKTQISNQLGRESLRLYELIANRFIACQMNEATFDQTQVDIDSGNKYLLRASGQRMKFDGWLAVYGEVKSVAREAESKQGNNGKEEAQEENKELPDLSIGEILTLLNILPQQKFTEPPSRYNEASLIKILEEKGIGRPSTYAPIISTIQDRKYVEKIERRFIPTELGFMVNDFLIEYFPDVFDVSFTAKMEDDLDSIANGNVEWIPVIHNFFDPLAERIQKVYKEAEKVRVDLGTTDEKCEKCGNPMVIKMSKYGKFLACSTFPECRFTKNILEKTGIVCPSCGGEIIVRKTRRGKQFYGCANYPTCKFAAWKKEDILNKSQISNVKT